MSLNDSFENNLGFINIKERDSVKTKTFSISFEQVEVDTEFRLQRFFVCFLACSA